MEIPLVTNHNVDFLVTKGKYLLISYNLHHLQYLTKNVLFYVKSDIIFERNIIYSLLI